MRQFKIAVLLILSITLLSSCSKDEATPDPLFTVSGTFDFQKATTIPDDAKVYAIWSVSEGDDYEYVYGEGTLNDDKSSYTISFDEVPPTNALNYNGLGVGIVVVTDGTVLAEGVIDDAIDPFDVLLGAATKQAIIYKTENAENARSIFPWLDRFSDGFKVGTGVPATDNETYDTFAPSSNSTIEVEINDFENLEFVNWT